MTEQSANLLFEKELESEWLASPFIWKQKASPTARSDWVWGIVTTEYDPEEAGSTTVIRMFRGNSRAEDFPVLKGFEVYEKDPVAVGDWNGDGDNELVIVDWEGQVRAYGFGNRPLAGVEPCPSPAAVILHPPLVVDVDNDGLAELVYLSLDVPPAGAVSALSIYDASGRPWHGFPLELDPPAVSSLVVASTRSGAKRLAFIREDGSIGVYDPLRRSLECPAGIPLATDPSATLGACDVDDDAEDEILLATGGDSLDCLDPGTGSWTRETVFQREYSAIVAVASGMTKNGSPVACAYDEAFHQFVFLSGGHTSFVSHPTARAGPKLVSLFRGPSLGEGGNVFVAVFFEPATEKDVEKVFEKHATPRMREAAARDVSPRSTEESKRELKRSLLVEQFGEEEADEMLTRPAATEVLLLDSGGNILGGVPIRVDDYHPFVAEDGTNVLRPAVLYEPSEAKLFVLVGLGEDMPGGAAYVQMYEVIL